MRAEARRFLGLAGLAVLAVAAAVLAPAGGRAHRLSPGLWVERPTLESLGVRTPGAVVLVRVDLARFEPVIATAREDGGERPLPAWAEALGLTAAINAAMFEADGTSSGLLRRAGRMLSSVDRPDFGGILALDPVAARPSARVLGRDCPRDEAVRRDERYGTYVQSLRLLDCRGGAIAWADPDRYAASGVGVDRRGRLVLMHSAAELRMRDLSRALAHPRAALASMLFTEGGDKAGLVVRGAEGFVVREAGSAIDAPEAFVALPLVLGVRPRARR